MDTRLLSDRFPRSNKYHPEWLIAGCSGGANPLWLTEWLSSGLDLRPGMRVLDLVVDEPCRQYFSGGNLRLKCGLSICGSVCPRT